MEFYIVLGSWSVELSRIEFCRIFLGQEWFSIVLMWREKARKPEKVKSKTVFFMKLSF